MNLNESPKYLPLSIFLWFGLPFLVLSLLSGVLQRQITHAFIRHASLINRMGGTLLVRIGVVDFLINWIWIRIFFHL